MPIEADLRKRRSPFASAAHWRRWAPQNGRAAFIPTSLHRVACIAIVASFCGCTDGATRIAYDIESGVATFQRSNATTYAIRHVPESIPDGCGGSYTVQFSAHSSLVIWCKESRGGKVTSSHATTYHLRFVKVPRTVKLDKAAGEPTIIELKKQNGTVVVTNVR